MGSTTNVGWAELRRSSRQQKSDQRKAALVELALQMAAVDGANAVTFDELSRAAGTSKSNVVLYFGTKQGLMLAIVEAAEAEFFARVVDASVGAVGVARVDALARAWCDRAAGTPGGCLLATLLHEFDATPGPVRDRLGLFLDRLRHVLGVALEDARGRGEVVDIDVDGALFRLLAVVLPHNLLLQLGAAPRFVRPAIAGRREGAPLR